MTEMPFDRLEQAYEDLARAIDQAGEDHEALFLSKLVLALAQRTGDLNIFRSCIEIALRDLDTKAPPVT